MEGERREDKQMHGVEGPSGSSERGIVTCPCPYFRAFPRSPLVDLTGKKEKKKEQKK